MLSLVLGLCGEWLRGMDWAVVAAVTAQVTRAVHALHARLLSSCCFDCQAARKGMPTTALHS